MTCSKCGGTVAVDRLRCDACGYDVLSEDIARRPTDAPRGLVLLPPLMRRLIHVVEGQQPLMQLQPQPTASRSLSADELARAIELNERIRRDRWKLVLVPLGVIGLMVISRLLQAAFR